MCQGLRTIYRSKPQQSKRSISKSTIGVIRRLAGSIKLLGAVGVAFVGFKKLIAAITSLREAAKLADEAMAKLIERQTELVKSSQEAAKAISGAVDTKRRKTPFTFGQEQSVSATLEAAPPELREALRPLLEEFGGAQGFGPAPGEFTGGELENLARLGFKPKDNASVRAGVSAARRFLKDRSGDAAILDQRDRDRKAFTTRGAAEEAVAGGEAGTASLDAIIGPLAEQFNVDPEVLRELSISELQREFKTRRRIEGLPPASRRKFLQNRESFPGQRIEPKSIAIPGFEEDRSDLGTPFVGEGDDRRASSPTEIAAVDEIFRRLLQAIDKLAEQPRIQIDNGRFYEVSAAARESARTNGESLARFGGGVVE